MYKCLQRSLKMVQKKTHVSVEERMGDEHMAAVSTSNASTSASLTGSREGGRGAGRPGVQTWVR